MILSWTLFQLKRPLPCSDDLATAQWTDHLIFSLVTPNITVEYYPSNIVIIKSNTLADFSGRSKCLTHPPSAKDKMLYKRSRCDIIRLKAENLTLQSCGLKPKKLWLETYSYYREQTW